MRKRETIQDEILGQIELVEPSYQQAQALFEDGQDKKFGLELVKMSMYRNGKPLFDDPDLSLSEGQAALKHVERIMALCGFGGGKK